MGGGSGHGRGGGCDVACRGGATLPAGGPQDQCHRRRPPLLPPLAYSHAAAARVCPKPLASPAWCARTSPLYMPVAALVGSPRSSGRKDRLWTLSKFLGRWRRMSCGLEPLDRMSSRSGRGAGKGAGHEVEAMRGWDGRRLVPPALALSAQRLPPATSTGRPKAIPCVTPLPPPSQRTCRRHEVKARERDALRLQVVLGVRVQGGRWVADLDQGRPRGSARA